MPTKSGFLWTDLFDRESEIKKNIQFYLVSGAVMTILLPPEYNNPFLLFIAFNTLSNKKLLADMLKAIKNPWVYLPFAYWLMVYISSFYSENSVFAGKEVEKLAALGFFPFVLALGPSLENRQVQQLKWHFIISVSILALYSIIFSFYNMFENGQFVFDWLQLSYENLVSGVGVQPLYFSMFIALALFFLFELQRLYKTGLAQILLMVFLFIYMIMLSTRMTTLAFFAIYGLYMLLLALKTRKYAYYGVSFLVFLITAIAIIVFNPVNKKRFAEALDPDSNYRTDTYGGRSLRLEKWKCSFEVFSSSPVVGVGVGDVQDELMNCYASKNIDSALFFRFNSHNQYLNTAAQTGLAGLILLLILLVGSAIKGIKNENDALLIFLMLFAMCILSESMMERRWGIFFFAFFYSIFHFYKIEYPFQNGIINWIKNRIKGHE
jgi:O-antigen ligase